MKLTWLILCWCYFTLPSSLSANTAEQQLIDMLFKNYNPLVRPNDPDKPVNVTVQLSIESIANVDDKGGSITIAGWVEMDWNDIFFCWDPADYGDVSYVIVPAEKVWRPDVAFNSALDKRFFEIQNMPVLISNDCSVAYAPGGLSTHSCDFDTTYFPFDSQVCEFTIMTWFSGSDQVMLQNDSLYYQEGSVNGIWDVIANSSAVDELGGKVKFSVTIKRKPLYYMTYIVLPLIMMAVLNLTVFWLPAHSGEKLTLAITVLLAFYILLITIDSLLPVTSVSTPLLAIGTSCLILMSTLSTILTVFVVHIHHIENRLVPRWVTTVLCLGRKKRYNMQVAPGEETQPAQPLPSWPEVSTAVDTIAFWVFLGVECAIIIFVCIGYAAMPPTPSNSE